MVVMDHESLHFFQAKDHANPRQICWQQFFQHFSFTVLWVNGASNKVTDCLSQMMAFNMQDDSEFEFHELVSADIRLDKECDDLPLERLEEAKLLVSIANMDIQLDFGELHLSVIWTSVRIAAKYE